MELQLSNLRKIELDSKYLTNHQDEGYPRPKSLEVERHPFWFSGQTLVFIAVSFGFVVVISRYLSTPVLMKAYPDWVSMQFNVVLIFLLVVMGVVLALLATWSIGLWRKSKSLRRKLKDEIGRRKGIEKDLARAREWSRTGNWILELSGRKMQWSDEIYQILGYRPQTKSETFQNFLKAVHLDDRRFVKAEIQKALKRGTAFNFTHRIVRRDGSIKIVKQRSEVYLNSEGQPTQIVGTLQDITDQKEAENLAARLGRILDRSFNEIYIFDAETYKFTKVNLAARLNLRYKMEEFCEMTLEDLLPEFAWDKVQKLMASLKRGVESVTAFETVHERKNGTTYPVDIRLQLLRTGSSPQFVAIVQDITDRKKVETFFNRAYQDLDKRVQARTLDLVESNKDLQIELDEHKERIEALEVGEHRWISIVNNVVDGIITIDEEGTIHFFNRAAEKLFGFNIEEVIGENIRILMAGANGAQGDEYFKNLLQSKTSADLGLHRVISVRKKDGAIFSAEIAVRETTVGNQRMFTGFLRNLTETMEIERQWMPILKPMAKS